MKNIRTFLKKILIRYPRVYNLIIHIRFHIKKYFYTRSLHEDTQITPIPLFAKSNELNAIIVMLELKRINIVISKSYFNVTAEIIVSNILKNAITLANDLNGTLRVIMIGSENGSKEKKRNILNFIPWNFQNLIEYYDADVQNSYRLELSKKDLYVSVDQESAEFVKKINLLNDFFSFSANLNKLIHVKYDNVSTSNSELIASLES